MFGSTDREYELGMLNMLLRKPQLMKFSKKLAEKQKDRRRSAAETRMVRMEVLSYPPEGELTGRKVVSSDIFSAEPLEIDEAAAKLEQAKHDFWVFLNAETNRVNIIYKRSNGDFGLIDPDV